MKHAAAAVILSVLAVFLGIILVTDALGHAFGKQAEVISLIVIAVILVILLIWNHFGKDDE